MCVRSSTELQRSVVPIHQRSLQYQQTTCRGSSILQGSGDVRAEKDVFVRGLAAIIGLVTHCRRTRIRTTVALADPPSPRHTFVSAQNDMGVS